MNLRAVWLLVIVAASCSAGLAGEPIRFVRPKSGEKAPLRFNFAAEKIQSREGLSAASLQPASDSASRSGGGIIVNPKARSAALARRNWASQEADPQPAERRGEAMNLESSESLDLGSSRARSDGSVFSPEAGLAPRGPGLGLPGASDRASGFSSDNRAALRSLSAAPFGNAGSRSGWPADGLGANGPAAGSLPPADVNPRREVTGSALGPRTSPDAPLGQNSGFGNSALSQQPESRRPKFDPSDRPLRSNFELPTRPR